MFRQSRILAIILVIFSAGAASAITPNTKSIEWPRAILMFGNSFTYFNNGVQQYLGPMLKEADSEHSKAYFFKQVTISGATLAEHRFGFEPAVKAHKWDAVVLQGNSTEPIVPRNEQELKNLQLIQGDAAPKDHKQATEEFKKYCRLYAKIIRDNGATPVLFMTWAYTGQPAMTSQLAEAYTSMGNELEALVVPVGLAFAKSLQQRPDLPMLIGDQRHPTLAGTYLIACTFFASLTHKSPVGLKFDAGLGDTATYLQNVAWETVQQYYASGVQ